MAAAGCDNWMAGRGRCGRNLLEAGLVWVDDGPVKLGGHRAAAGGRALVPDQVRLVVARILHHQERNILLFTIAVQSE